jgi:hypothetical protein
MIPGDAYAKRGFVLYLEVVAAWPKLVSKPRPLRILVPAAPGELAPNGQTELEAGEVVIQAAGCTVHYYARPGARVSLSEVASEWATEMSSILRPVSRFPKETPG